MIENDTNYTNTAVPKTVPVSAEAAAKATQQEDDENDDDYKSDRHDLHWAERCLFAGKD